MKKQMDLCLPCSLKLKEAFTVKRIQSRANQKITCANCGRRRYGATYEVSNNADKT